MSRTDTGKVSCAEQTSGAEALISSSHTEITASPPAGNRTTFQKDTTEIVNLCLTAAVQTEVGGVTVSILSI